MKNSKRTFVVIGAGPVGISAAIHLKTRELTPLVLEKGDSAGYAVKEWGHVRVFTPWQYVTDKAVVERLERTGWQHPDKEHIPTGKEIVEEYLEPAAALPELKDHIIYDAEVTGVSKQGLSKSSSRNRDEVLYIVHYKEANGRHRTVEAAGVIDASGTWYDPNPIGADGLPVDGEEEIRESIAYGIPDALGRDKNLYKGRRVLVLGGGHSAINIALDVLSLKEEDSNTKLFWGLRQNNPERLFGGGVDDELPARGALGAAARAAIEAGALELLAPLQIKKIEPSDNGLLVEFLVDGRENSIEVDRIVVATGFRPNLNMLRELRLDLDAVVEAPKILAPMIDPNHHSCGTVKPHGVNELSHPDKNFFIAGMKSYGRAPTFLMLTGYEQVRSIADELSGNHEAARIIKLNLPETGVCNSRPQGSAGGTILENETDSPCCAPGDETAAVGGRCCG